jgi:hypothetical protein
MAGPSQPASREAPRSAHRPDQQRQRGRFIDHPRQLARQALGRLGPAHRARAASTAQPAASVQPASSSATATVTATAAGECNNIIPWLGCKRPKHNRRARKWPILQSPGSKTPRILTGYGRFQADPIRA